MTFTLMFLPTFVDGSLYVEAVALVIATPLESHWYLNVVPDVQVPWCAEASARPWGPA